MKKYIFILLVYTSVFAIGLEGLTLPLNTSNLSLSNSGIASRNNIYYNPASFSYNDEMKFNFTSLNWLDQLSGSSFHYLFNNNLITVFNIGADDINMYGDNPSEDPLDIISSNLLRIGYSKGAVYNHDIRVGVSIYFNYYDIFPNQYESFTYTIGFQKALNKNINVGMIVENFGSSKYDLPSNYGLGISYFIDETNTEILLDYKYSQQVFQGEEKGTGFHFGLMQPISRLLFNFGCSKYSTRTTLSTGIDVKLTKRIKLSYSILSNYKSAFGLTHYVGFEFSL